MALPVLSNDKPMYEVTVPSSQETYKFRPFLVKEQKSLLVAFASQDNKQILTTMLNCIESCVPGLDIKKLATFDMDYVFTQIRAKSVGETSTILSACIKCKEEKPIHAFRVYKRNADNRDNRCEECIQHSVKVIERLKLTAPEKPLVCDCCKKPPKKRFVLDHCHTSELFRGWLCDHCNLALGLLGDNVEGVERALEYLQKHEEENG